MQQGSDLMEFSGGFSMSREYYYTTIASWGNYATDEEPIVVNCADFTDKVRNGTTKVSKGRLDYSVCFLSEGNMFFAIGDGEEQEIGGGTVVIVPPKTPMRYGQREQAVRRCYWVHFTGSHAASLVEQCGFESGGIFRLPDERGAAAAFNELLDEMKNPPTPRSRLRAAAATVMLLTHLGRMIERGVRQRRLPHSVAYIREHFAEEIDKTALAEMDGLRPSQYHLVFRNVMGCTPAGYIASLRMMKARRLLLDPEMPVGEVAQACGYDDPLYFSRVFRRVCGVSPSEYRRRGL